MSMIQNIANNSLKCLYGSCKDTVIMCNEDFDYNGQPDPVLCQKDKVHLSQQGTKVLASKLKWEIYNSLNIK